MLQTWFSHRDAVRMDVTVEKWLYFCSECKRITITGNAFLSSINYRFGHFFVIPSGCENQLDSFFSLSVVTKNRLLAHQHLFGVISSCSFFHCEYTWCLRTSSQRIDGWMCLQFYMVCELDLNSNFAIISWLLCVRVRDGNLFDLSSGIHCTQ